MYDLSVKGAMEFNQKFPSAAIPKDCQSDGATLTPNGVYHYSWIGSAKVTNVLDIVDTPIVTAGTLLMPNEKNHDGLIPICSAKYGKVIRDNYKLNHFDEVNQILGLKSVFAPDPISIFRQHANRLKIQGL
jgi:triacylglycerol lipase